MAETFNNIFYSELFTAFMLFLFSLSFFTKSNSTRTIGIWFFGLMFIITPFKIAELLNIYNEINKIPTIEIGKMIGSLLWALVFLLYFIFSKRVKKTFIHQRDNYVITFFSLIIPMLLLWNYEKTVNTLSDNTKLYHKIIEISDNNFKNKNYNKSLNNYIKAFNIKKQYSVSTEFVNEIADKFFDIKQYENAIKLYKKNINDNSARFRLAYSYSAIKDYDNAIKYYEKYLENNQDEGAMRNLGLVYERVNKNKKAQEWFKKAFDIYIKKGRDGDKEAAKWLALMYKYGEGTKQNYKKAQYWENKSK